MELICKAINLLTTARKSLKTAKKSLLSDNSQLRIQWLIAQSEYVEECVRILSKKHLEGILPFVKKNIEAIRTFNVKSEKYPDISKPSKGTNAKIEALGENRDTTSFLTSLGNTFWYFKTLTTLMTSMTLSLAKSYISYEFKGTNAKIEALNENKDSLILLNELHEILRTSSVREHHSLLEQLLGGFSALPYVPVASELKVLVDMGLTSLEHLEDFNRNIDCYYVHQSDRPDDSCYHFSYEGLAREFFIFESLSIMSNHHIIGIRLNFYNFDDFYNFNHFKIPKSINLLTKLKILIIENQVVSSLGTIPDEIAELTNLRILYVINLELNEFPKEFAQLSKMRYLYIINSNLKDVPNLSEMFPKLRRLGLKGVDLKSTPNWLFEFARSRHSREYIREGTIKEDAAVLGLLEILTDEPLENMPPVLCYNLPWHTTYNDQEGGGFQHTLNKSGNVIELDIGWWRGEDIGNYVLLPYFPEEISKLKYLEALRIGLLYKRFRLFLEGEIWNMESKTPESLIPESIRELKSLRLFWTNAKYSESLKPFINSLEKFGECWFQA